MQTLKDRLVELINNEGLNPNQFYLKTGLGNGFLNTVGEKLKRPSIEKISKAFPLWNIDYLQTGKGDMLKKEFNAGRDNNIRNIQSTGSMSGTMVTGDGNTILAEKDQQILLLENEVKYLKEIIAEKERFIQALLSNK